MFEKDLDKLDHRSKFANRVLKLIYNKHNGDMDSAILEAEPFFKDFEEHIRNIYEVMQECYVAMKTNSSDKDLEYRFNVITEHRSMKDAEIAYEQIIVRKGIMNVKEWLHTRYKN